MDFIVRALSHVLVPCFFLGMAGSLVVVAITIVQDMGEIFSSDEPLPSDDNLTGT